MSTIMAIQFVAENHWLAFGRKAPRLHLHPAGCLFLSYSSGKTSLVRGQYKLEADAMMWNMLCELNGIFSYIYCFHWSQRDEGLIVARFESVGCRFFVALFLMNLTVLFCT